MDYRYQDSKLFPSAPSNKLDWPWTVGNDVKTNSIFKERRLPKISIVTPSYNQGEFIEKTIRSVLLQNYPNLEYIIIDGGSTDSTKEIISKYEKHITYWVSEKDKGQAHAINKGFKKATGDIYAWLNSDDYYLENALLKVVKSFGEIESAQVIVGKGHKVTNHGDVVYTPKVSKLSFEALLDWKNYHFMQPSCFFKAEAWDECGPLREDLYFCMDVDLWLKMSQKFKFAKIDDVLSHAIIHPNAKTTAEKERMKVETALLVSQYGAIEIAQKTLMDLADENFRLKHIVQDYRKKSIKGLFHRVKTKLLSLTQ